MAAIKFHVFRTEMGDSGQENCDYRGAGELGAGENDQHRTIAPLEVDPASDALILSTTEKGPDLNKLLAGLASEQPEWLDDVASALGLEGSGPVGIRVGVWDH